MTKSPFSFPKSTITPVGASFASTLTLAEWKAMWPTLRSVGWSVNFVLGDWLNWGMTAYGQKYARALERSEADYQTLANCAWVCRAVPIPLRRVSLDWSHHKEVAALPPTQQKHFLGLADDNHWSVSLLRSAIRESLSEMKEKRAPSVGFVPRVWVSEGLRWLQRQDFDEWEPERREALRGELEPIVTVWKALSEARG